MFFRCLFSLIFGLSRMAAGCMTVLSSFFIITVHMILVCFFVLGSGFFMLLGGFLVMIVFHTLRFLFEKYSLL